MSKKRVRNYETNGNGQLKIKEFKPKTNNQAEYIRSIIESDYILCSGPAGSGKTCCAVNIACEHLCNDKIKSIIVTRPVIETTFNGRGLGFLPGDFQSKIHPYLIPILDEMYKRFGTQIIKEYISKNVIQVVPLEYMRGRNFHDSIMILDECQNATIEQVKMFVTRVGQNTTCILNGDITQSDLPQNIDNGLSYYINKWSELDFVSIIHLTDEDIIRSNTVAKIMKYL